MTYTGWTGVHGADRISWRTAARVAEVQTIAVDRVQAQRIGNRDAAGLKRNELTPYGKRWQLWGNGIKGVEADKIIEDLYGPLAQVDSAVAACRAVADG